MVVLATEKVTSCHASEIRPGNVAEARRLGAFSRRHEGLRSKGPRGASPGSRSHSSSTSCPLVLSKVVEFLRVSKGDFDLSKKQRTVMRLRFRKSWLVANDGHL